MCRGCGDPHYHKVSSGTQEASSPTTWTISHHPRPGWTDCAVTLANRSDIMKKHSVATILHIATKLEYEDAHEPIESSILE